MEIQFYAIAEWLGLVTDLRAFPGDETWRVSADAGTVFAWLGVAFALALFALGLLLGRICASRTPLRLLIGLCCLYAALLTVGIGPYIKFYPTGGGFIDLDIVEHIASGILWLGRAALIWAGGRLGRQLRAKKETPAC